jgi:hypothetical protein
MTRDEIDTMWQQALHESVVAGEDFIRYHFTALVAEAEADKHNTGTHTCSNRCQRYACVAVREAVAAEREACAKLCDGWTHADGDACAVAIRARGEA